MTPSQRMWTAIGMLIFFILSWFWYHDGVFSKVWVVTYQKWSFWAVTILFAFGFPVWRRWANPKGFTVGEGIAQACIMPIVAILVHSFFFYTTTELKDKEYLNAYAIESRYFEEWTGETEHENCDSKGENCTTYTTCDSYHPPYWEVWHSIDVHGGPRITRIKSAHYLNYRRYFRNERSEWGANAGQCSVGDGRVFITTFQGSEEERISTAMYHDFVNYVKGSARTLRRVTSETLQFRDHLRPYPQLKEGDYGKIELNRVIIAKVSPPSGWAETVDRELDRALNTLGEKRQVNLLVYVVGTNDQAFIYALKNHWVGGKKNDVIVVIGSADGNHIDWVDASMAWTKNELFKVELRDRIYDLEQLEGNAEAVAHAIVDQVQQPGEHGFIRQPMAELEYLAADVEIPWYCWLAILISMGVFGWMISWALENNDIREWREE